VYPEYQKASQSYYTSILDETSYMYIGMTGPGLTTSAIGAISSICITNDSKTWKAYPLSLFLCMGDTDGTDGTKET